MRDLHTGEVNGDDPLKMYAPENRYAYGRNSIETRAWQVRRVMDFPHAGDLMVVSTLYPDGTVAAFEELIGNHGGLGGEQTDAFVFHPRSMTVPEVRNSTEVFEVLNARRGQPITPEESRAEAAVMSRQVDEWSPVNLWNGIRDVRTWVPLALRALVLDRSAYRQVANDPRMTGPGLLLGVALSALSAGSLTGDLRQFGYAAWSGTVSWVIATIAVYIAGRTLARRGYYTRTMRTLGFAQVMAVASLLALIPDALGVILVLYLLLEFVALWMAASAAHAVGGWRSLLLPVMASLLATVIPLLVSALLASAVGGIESVMGRLGLTGAR